MKSMSIQKIFLSSAIILGSMLTILFSVIFTEMNTVQNTSEESEKMSTANEEVLRGKLNVIQIQQFLTDASLVGDLDGIKEAEQNLTELKTSLKKLEVLVPELKEKYLTLNQEADLLFSSGKLMVDAYLKKGKAEGDAIMKQQSTGFDALSDKLGDDLEKTIKHISDKNNLANQKESDSIRLLKLSTKIFIVLFIIIFLAVLLTLLKRITRLRQMILELKDFSSKVHLTGKDIADTSQDLSSSATQAAASIETTTASSEEISSMVKMNADSAEKAKELSVEAKNKAERGREEVHLLVESMKGISESSKKIVEIISVIDDLAFQTNLLALNAAVEAARAGEQGKGFAVVAEAVRGLAQKSAISAKEIADLIKTSVSQTESGFKIALASDAALQEIVSASEKVSQLNAEMSAANKEQASGIQEINKSINEIDHATQINAASAEKNASSSSLLTEQSELLNKVIKEFEGLVGI